MSDVVVRTVGLTKEYRIGPWSSGQTRLIEMVGQHLGGLFKRDKRKHEILRALDGVDMEIRQGEVVGLIGRNGAGKSTLLKILSRITRPNQGYAELHGRVGSLLEAGTGFHPELSGRENIYLTGSIVGLSRKGIQDRFDEIVDFAGTERFIDTPVKFYSSGMKVRLGFAVSAHLEPEIMLVDEVLAVGDLAFQRKCLDHLHKLTSRGMTIVLVSHHMAAIQSACTRAILLEKGHIESEGTTSDVVARYQSLLLGEDPEASAIMSQADSGAGVRIVGFKMLGEAGEETRALRFGEAARIRVEVEFDRPIENPTIVFGIRRSDGIVVCSFNNWYDDLRLGKVEGRCVVDAWLPPLRLTPDFYEGHVLVWPWAGIHMQGDIASGAPYASGRFTEFQVTGPPLGLEAGVFQIPALRWHAEHSEGAFDKESIPPDEVEMAFDRVALSSRAAES